MKTKFKILFFLSFSIFLNSCSSDENSNENSNLVNIGMQTWQTKNLNVDTYRDGPPIPQVTDATQWNNLTTGAWCYYNNDPALGQIYGKLYNWYAVAGIHNAASLNDPSLRKQLAPQGWHIPTDAEWSVLVNTLDPNADIFNVAGGKMKSIGTIQNGNGLWESPNTDATNESGFYGFPGGYRYSGVAQNSNPNNFYSIGFNGSWWTSSQTNSGNNAWIYGLGSSRANLQKNGMNVKEGRSVRCIKD